MSPDAPPEQPQEELPPYKIEGARSSRSKCKSCRKPIQKGAVRLGVLIDGPFGQGYLWHHINCAAKRQAEAVEEAYAGEFWEEGLEIPPIEKLRDLAEKAEKQKAEKKLAPYVEVAPTGRSKCRHCGELIEQGGLRVGLLREVEFYGQTRSGPINVHAACVKEALEAEDCLTETEDFEEALRVNSTGTEIEIIDRALEEIGLDS